MRLVNSSAIQYWTIENTGNRHRAAVLQWCRAALGWRVDFAMARITSVLSRIGLCYLLAGSFIALSARFRDGAISPRPALIAGIAAYV
ncbi:MAG TPA: hypothetical protein VK624_15965 [Steroidobacteraceae bacterium]|nr:hypothetical protein [Steroidobacteraceae bacterium]